MEQFANNSNDDKRFISHIQGKKSSNITFDFIFSSFEFLMLKISNVTVNAIKILIKARSIELENNMKVHFTLYMHNDTSLLILVESVENVRHVL